MHETRVRHNESIASASKRMVTAGNCFRRIAGCSRVPIEFDHQTHRPTTNSEFQTQVKAPTESFQEGPASPRSAARSRKVEGLKDVSPGTPVRNHPSPDGSTADLTRRIRTLLSREKPAQPPGGGRETRINEISRASVNLDGLHTWRLTCDPEVDLRVRQALCKSPRPRSIA